MTSSDPDTDALMAGADVEVPADAPAGTTPADDQPALTTDTEAQNDDLPVNPTNS